MKIASFFSGCGGMDLGFIQAGFDVVFANDNNKKAAATYFYNIGPIDMRSIYDIDDLPRHVDGIIGGPPCQSWSAAGAMRGPDDPNGKLFWKFIYIIAELRPKFFVAENVKGILSERNVDALMRIDEALMSIGYDMRKFVVNMSDYGIAQDRERVFFIGFEQPGGGENGVLDSWDWNKKSLHTKFEMPEMKEKRTLQDVLLPEADTPDAVEWYDGSFSPRYMSRNRIRGWHEQSFTIPATARHIPLHPSSYPMIKKGPDQWGFSGPVRRLSVRDCARIQTFPDSYVFSGSMEEKYRQIGNAVPPEIAKQIAIQIKKVL